MLDGQNQTGAVTDALLRARADLTGAKRRVTMLELFETAIAGMKAQGFEPEFEVDDGVAMLSVEIEAGEREATAELVETKAPEVVTAPAASEAPAAPEAQPAPAATPEPEVTAPAAEQERVTGPFTPAEDETIKKLATEGKMTAEIATALNRAPQGVGARIRCLNDQSVGPKPMPRPVQTTRPAEAVEPENDMSNGMSAGERQARRLVRAAGYPKPWTPEKDLALFEAICAGRKLPYAAEAAKVTTEMAKERWNAIFPAAVRTYEAQSQMIQALRKLASEAAG